MFAFFSPDSTPAYLAFFSPDPDQLQPPSSARPAPISPPTSFAFSLPQQSPTHTPTAGQFHTPPRQTFIPLSYMGSASCSCPRRPHQHSGRSRHPEQTDQGGVFGSVSPLFCLFFLPCSQILPNSQPPTAQVAPATPPRQLSFRFSSARTCQFLSIITCHNPLSATTINYFPNHGGAPSVART